jgi:hypothetical protein
MKLELYFIPPPLVQFHAKNKLFMSFVQLPHRLCKSIEQFSKYSALAIKALHTTIRNSIFTQSKAYNPS